MKGLSLKLKGRLYSAFVHSEMLYNCEVWVINKGEMEALEGKNVYLMRKVANKVVRDGEERLSNQQLRQMLGLESIEEMIRKKRLQWAAHSARRGEADQTWRRMRRDIEDARSGWGRQMLDDWKELRVESADHWCSLVEDKAWLRKKLGAGGSSSRRKRGRGVRVAAEAGRLATNRAQ